MYLLGYDIGTSSIKASILDAHTNQVIGSVSYPDREIDIISKFPGWAEQHPEIWWSHLCVATKKLLAQTAIESKNIKGIGISYQMHGLVLIDKDHQVLRPAIIWCDSRAVDIGNQAFKALGETYCLNSYLNSPGNFTASKLKWVKENEPAIYQAIHKILLPGDYINMKLSGAINTTISGLSEGIFWNFKEKKIAEKLIQYFGFHPDLIPDRVPTFSAMGHIDQIAAVQTGLELGTPITYRAGDQPNNAMSLNVLRKGEIAATCGTSGVVYGIVDRPTFDLGSRVNAFAHVNYEDKKDKIGILLCINGAGSAYRWIKHQMVKSDMTYDSMEKIASAISIGSDGLRILPFGNGAERMLSNKAIEGHMSNIDFNRHSLGHIIRATLESVAFAFVYGINILQDMGLTMEVIKVSNDNMFQSKIFSQTIASILGIEIQVLNTSGAMGAARAAGVHIGAFKSVENAFSKVKSERVYKPQGNQLEYKEAYNKWLKLLHSKTQFESNQQRTSSFDYSSKELNQALKTRSKTIATNSLKIENIAKTLKSIQNQIKEVYTESQNQKLADVLTQLKKIEVTPQEKEAFEEHFDMLNDGFLKRLKTECPALTFDELKVCAMLKLNLSSKEIANNLNLSIRGIETKRYRIRKKLEISKGISLTKYFAYISH